MGEISSGLAAAFPDGAAASKRVIRALGPTIEAAISSAGSNISRYATVTAMNAVTSAATGQLAYVFANNAATDDPANLFYQWNGAAWVEAEWYANAAAAAVQPLVDDAEGARDDALAAASAGYNGQSVLGQPGAFASGSTVGNKTWVFGDVVKRTSRVSRIEITAGGATTLTLRRFRKVASAIDKVAGSTDVAVAIASGANDLSYAAGDFDLVTLQPGELLGFHYLGSLPYTVETADGAGWYQGGGNANSFTEAEPVAGFRMQIRITLETVGAAVTTLGNAAARRLEPDYILRGATWWHLIGYGQSNSTGADATPALTTAASAFHKTFNVGPKMTKPAISGGGNADDGAIKALVEDNVSPIGSGTYGETHLSTAVREYTRRQLQRAPGMQIWFASTAGLSSTGIIDLLDSSVWYQNLLYHIVAGQREAAQLGLGYAVPAITFDHGETDQANAMAKDTYKVHARALFDQIGRDVRETTGQAFLPHFLFTSPAYSITVGDGPSEALRELSQERPDVHLAVPAYRLPQANGTHESNVGQILKGAYYARALDQLAQGLKPHCVEWLNAVVTSTTLDVYARAPTVLQLSNVILGAAADSGIKVVDGTGTLTLSAIGVSQVGTDPATGWPISRVRMTLNRTLGTTPTFRYAKDFLGSGLTISSGASGNIFDSNTETISISGTPYSLAHPAPPCTLSIVAAE